MTLESKTTTLETLIELGRKEDFAALESILPRPRRYVLWSTLMMGPQECQEVARRLGDEDLVALVKVLTVVEAQVTGFLFGSVSPVIWLHREYVSRSPSRDGTLAEWILSHTKNDYLPWGRLGCRARTLGEFHDWETNKDQKHVQAVAAETDRQKMAHEEKLRREQEGATRNLPNAIRRQDVGAIAPLLKKGADVSAPNRYGKSAKELALETGNARIISMLVQLPESGDG